MRKLVLAAACGASLLLGACARETETTFVEDSEVSDQEVLDNLRDAGSDLSKPHDVDFSFYFPDAGAAQRFMTTVIKRPTSKKVSLHADDDSEPMVEVTRSFIPSLAEIERNSRELSELAEAEGGEFDGWGAAVVN